MSSNFEYDVFLSHSSKDKPIIRQAASKLESAGLKVWLDEKCILPGDDIYLSIENGLQSSRILLLFISPNSLGSDWVLMERNTTLFRDPINKQRRLIPIVLEQCDLPDTLKRYKYLDYYKEPPNWLDAVLKICDIESPNQTQTKECQITNKTEANGEPESTLNSIATLAQYTPQSDKAVSILYVDDEEKSLISFQRNFQDDYTILIANSVSQALETIKSNIHTLGVVITDQRMPSKTGVDLLKILRQDHPQIIRVLTTAYSDFKSLTEAINLGSIHAFISKPWDVVEVQIVLNRAQDAHRLEKTKTLALHEFSKKSDQITKSIDFPPQHYNAAVQMLTYFGTILKQRHPQYSPAVTITQQGQRVTMKIDPVDSPPEVIEAELDSYGRLLVGSITLKEYTSDFHISAGLQHQMHLAAEQIPGVSKGSTPLDDHKPTNKSGINSSQKPEERDQEIARLTNALKDAKTLNQALSQPPSNAIPTNAQARANESQLWQIMSFQLLQHSLIILIENLGNESGRFDLYNWNKSPLVKLYNLIVIKSGIEKLQIGAVNMYNSMAPDSLKIKTQFLGIRLRFSLKLRLYRQLVPIKEGLSKYSGNNLDKEILAHSEHFLTLRTFLDAALVEECDTKREIANTLRGVEDTRTIAAHYNILAHWCGVPPVEAPEGRS